MDYDNPTSLRPLVACWSQKLALARQSQKYKDFRDTAEQCMGFFSGSVGLMWEPKWQKRFLGANIAPKFRITLNKAFELVALYAPSLYDHNPTRNCKPYEAAEFGPECFGPPGDPMAMQAFQQAQMQQGWEFARKRAMASVLEKYLNYTPREQPSGGLKQSCEDAITELLIKGRGLLWVEPYQHPGSGRKLTGCFYDSVDRFYSDPDATTINFGDTQWIMRERIEPYWQVERKFKLPVDSLKGKGSYESSEAQAGRRSRSMGNLERERGGTKDLFRYHEAYSCGGIGLRGTGNDELERLLHDAVGDFAYIAFAEDVPWPLNCHPDVYAVATTEEIRRAFSWPIPYCYDQRWPVAILDAYREPNNPWPISPLKPGLGELTFLNVVISHIANRAWQDSRTIVAVVESAAPDVEKALRSNDDLVAIKLKDQHQDLNRVISEFQHRPMSPELFAVVDRVSEMFDKRVGLSDLWYAMNSGGISRSAADVRLKEEKASIRPEHLTKKVDDWMQEAGRMEKMAAYWSGVSGQDVRPLLGTVAAGLWDQLIASADPEELIYEMDVTVEPGASKRPNRQRDAANLGQVYSPLSRMLMGYAQATGDFGPINELNRRMMESMEVNPAGLQMQPPQPPPPPEAGPEGQPAGPEQDPKVQLAMAMGQQKLEQKEAQHAQRLQHKEQDQVMRMTMMQAMSRLKRMNAAPAMFGEGVPA